MKRFISICLFFCLLLSIASSCLAEDFIIHSGVIFGDGRKEILEKETMSLFAETDDNRIIYEGTLAGIDKSRIYYFLNSEGDLIDATYEFPSASDVGFTEVLEEYKQLLAALTEKYGQPLDNTDDICLVRGNAISHHYEVKSWYAADNIPVEMNIDVISWSVPSNDNFVKIDLIYNTTTNSAGSYAYCSIDYYPYSDEDVKQAIEQYKDYKQIQLDDL